MLRPCADLPPACAGRALTTSANLISTAFRLQPPMELLRVRRHSLGSTPHALAIPIVCTSSCQTCALQVPASPGPDMLPSPLGEDLASPVWLASLPMRPPLLPCMLPQCARDYLHAPHLRKKPMLKLNYKHVRRTLRRPCASLSGPSFVASILHPSKFVIDTKHAQEERPAYDSEKESKACKLYTLQRAQPYVQPHKSGAYRTRSPARAPTSCAGVAPQLTKIRCICVSSLMVLCNRPREHIKYVEVIQELYSRIPY